MIFPILSRLRCSLPALSLPLHLVLIERLPPTPHAHTFIKNARIPIVKCTHGPTDISVDISFDVPTGPAAAELMQKFLSTTPPLRPLTMVLKQYLACRNLNQPYHGGLGSFALQLMIISFLQQRSKEDDAR